jgi:hypothetical protein
MPIENEWSLEFTLNHDEIWTCLYIWTGLVKSIVQVSSLGLMSAHGRLYHFIKTPELSAFSEG